jgi:tetratricopeptide (TPR) repeat protein
VKELNGGRSDVKADAAMLRRVAVAEGAPYVLFSELGELGGRRELRLKLERNGRVIDNETFPFAETNDLPAVATDAADWLRGKLQRPGVKARDAGLPELTTDKWDALQAYVRGDEAWKEHRQEDAAREFEEALRIDPEFAGAEARLGDILTAAWRVDDGLAHWSRAAALARGKALAGREMLRIRGVFALDTGDVAEAERALALFVASYPEEPLAHYYYSSVAMRLKRPAQALEMMETAVRLNPGNYAFQVGLADVRMFRGELEEAKAALRKALPMRPEDGTARRGLAAVEFAESHYDECRKHLESILEQANESSQSLAYSALACLEAEMGRSGEILKWLDKGMDLDRRLNALSALGQKMRLKAEYYLAAGDKRAAVSACDEIRGLGLGAQAEMEAGCLLARAGDVSKAAICRVKELADWPIYLHWERRLEGEMALARGDARAALRLMAGAPPREDNAYWPEFLFRAAMAAGDKARAKGMRQELESTLAYRWFDPERTALGFVRMARSIA